MTDTRDTAIERIENRRRFREEVLRYVAVNGFFVALWALGGGGFFWPAFTLVAWGLHLAIRLIGVSGRPITAEEITREMERTEAGRGSR